MIPFVSPFSVLFLDERDPVATTSADSIDFRLAQRDAIRPFQYFILARITTLSFVILVNLDAS